MEPSQTWIRSSVIAFALLVLSTAAPAGVSRWTSLGPRGNALIIALVSDPATPDTVYAATAGGGVFKSEDGGESWKAVNAGLDEGYVTALAVDPTAPGTLYAATSGSGVFKTTDGGKKWRRAADGMTHLSLDALALDPSRPSTLYAAGSSSGELYRSTADGAATWTRARGLVASGYTIGTARGVASESPVDPGVRSLRSQDGGDSWQLFETGPLDALAIDPRDPTTFYASAGTHFVKWTNGGKSRTSSATPWHASAIALSREDSARIVAGTPNGEVYSSADSGASWQRLKGFSSKAVVTAVLVTGREFPPALSCMMPRWSRAPPLTRRRPPIRSRAVSTPRGFPSSPRTRRIPPRCSLRTDTPLPDVGRRRQLECGRHGFRTLILRGDLVGRLCRSRRLVGRFVSHRRRRPDLDAHGPRISS